MAQSADLNPTPDQREAPAHNTTSLNMAIPDDQSTQYGTSSKIIPQAPPELTGTKTTDPALGLQISSVTNPIPATWLDGPATDDEGDMQLAINTTFDDFYQSVPEDMGPPPPQAIEQKIAATTDEPGTPPKAADDFVIDEVTCSFSTPFIHGFRRRVEIDQTGSLNISYLAPDTITRLDSRTAMERYLVDHPILDPPELNFCWDKIILGFHDTDWETICTPNPRQWYSRMRSEPPIAPSIDSTRDDSTPPTVNTTDVCNPTGTLPTSHPAPTPKTHTAGSKTPIRDRDPLIPRPIRLDNTLKPSVNLNPDMTITEAENWLKGFVSWFKWNAPILDNKDPATKRVLLENFLDDKMLSKLRADVTITDDTLIEGDGGLISKLRSYYHDDYPIFRRRHDFATCTQDPGEPFFTWWERKLKRAQECMIMTMTTDNWLEMELIRGANDPKLKRRLLQERNPILNDMVCIARQWQSAENTTTQFIVDNEPNETESEPEDTNDHYGMTNNPAKGPVPGNPDEIRDQQDKDDATKTTRLTRTKTGDPIRKLNDETDTPRCENNNHMTGTMSDRRPVMYNVKITPVNSSGYHFTTNVYPDTGELGTIIAANVTERQRMSILPHTMQLRSAGGRQWKISGSTTFDVEYQGRSARVKARISPSIEDDVFFGWTTLRDLMSGSIYGNTPPTTTQKANHSHDIEPDPSHNHTTLLPAWTSTPGVGYPPQNPCAGCGEDKFFHQREHCPSRRKMCYNCGRTGHIREVCRRPLTGKTYHQDTNLWPHGIDWDRKYPLSTPECKNMSQYPYLPIRSLGEPGTPAEQHKRWINDEPYRETEVKTEKKRWIKHFRQNKRSRAQSQDLDGESRKRSNWWHTFLVETGDITQDDATFE